MKLSEKKRLSAILITSGVAAVVIGMALLRVWESNLLSGILGGAGLGAMGAGGFIASRGGRCPHCGKHLPGNWRLTSCPDCGKSLEEEEK